MMIRIFLLCIAICAAGFSVNAQAQTVINGPAGAAPAADDAPPPEGEPAPAADDPQNDPQDDPDAPKSDEDDPQADEPAATGENGQSQPPPRRPGGALILELDSPRR